MNKPRLFSPIAVAIRYGVVGWVIPSDKQAPWSDKPEDHACNVGWYLWHDGELHPLTNSGFTTDRNGQDNEFTTGFYCSEQEAQWAIARYNATH